MRPIITLLLLSGFLQAGELTKPDWNWYGGWQINSDSARITHTPGTWPKLIYARSFKADTVYRLRFLYLAPEGGLFCRTGKYTAKLSPQKEFAPVDFYFKTDNQGKAELCCFTSGESPVHAEVKDISIEEFDGKANAVHLDFNRDPGPLPTSFYRHVRWERDGSDKLGTLTVVPADDHVDGGKAMRLKLLAQNPPKRINAVSLPVPVIPGRRYRVGGWFKADRDGKAQVIVDGGWEKGLEHWVSFNNFTVSPSWQHRSFEIEVPKEEKIAQLKSGVLTLSIGMFCENCSELDVKEITWSYIR